MIGRAVAKVKIVATNEVVATVKAYGKALQFCVDQAWNRRIRNNVKLHPFVYKQLRQTLPAQLAVACIKQACGIVKKAKTKPVVQKASIGYNFPRSARLKGDVLSIATVKGRQEFSVKVPACYAEYFKSWKLTESLLRIDKKGWAYFLFGFSKEAGAINSALQKRVLGVDLGVNNLAVTSDGGFFHSFRVKQVKRKFKYLRSVLQAKGTRSAKSLLKKVSGREKRFMAWVNHNISKSIVSAFDGGKIVLEDLKGIRGRWLGKRMNYWISNWSFFQLQSFIRYKAERRGLEVVRVKPAFTSKLCHKCGALGVRKSGCFSCFHCGLSSYSADLNAARNLAHPMLVERQAAVNQPNVSGCEAQAPSVGELKAELRGNAPPLAVNG